MNDMCETI
jgi:hypothetical protein